MNEEGWTIRLTGHERYLMMNRVELYVTERRDRRTFYAKEIVLEELPEQQSLKPLLSFSGDDFKADQIPTLQLLMDDLWRLGYRPTEAHAGDARVQALKDHLEDMRLLALGEKYRTIGGKA